MKQYLLLENAEMRTITTVAVTVMLFALVGCGKQDKPSQDAEESQTTVSVPKVDLHSAVVTDNFEAIRQHIEAGSDINVLEPSRASTPLITAAALGKAEAANILVDAGAELNYKNADGSTALHTAAVFDKTEVAKILIDAGADLNCKNNDGSTALHAAAFFCREEIVEALLEKGADKSIRNKSGRTALETAELPFEDLKGAYDAIGAALRPVGLALDYDRIRASRPKIAEMLK
jgi:ankyrin repeat protein